VILVVMAKIQLIVSPYDSGHPNARMGNGPHRLLQEGLAEKLRKQKHIVQSATLQPAAGKFRTEVGVAYDLMELARQTALTSHEHGFFPIALSGNCNISIGMISALQSNSGPRLPLCGLMPTAISIRRDHAQRLFRWNGAGRSDRPLLESDDRRAAS
jgi:arginase